MYLKHQNQVHTIYPTTDYTSFVIIFLLIYNLVQNQVKNNFQAKFLYINRYLLLLLGVYLYLIFSLYNYKHLSHIIRQNSQFRETQYLSYNEECRTSHLRLVLQSQYLNLYKQALNPQKRFRRLFLAPNLLPFLFFRLLSVLQLR